ncbi:MAG TPA: DNA repair exonuclease [Planctomycetota bacterium]|nr:DNA repair exonuclease [Planctomycetota bacterium]
MPTILHTADVHLGRPWSGLEHCASRLADLQWRSFERLADLALEHEVAALVVAGDLFDRPGPEAALVEQVRGALRRLTDEGIAVVVAPGTHDAAASSRSVYRTDSLPAGVRTFLNPRLGERFVVERDGSAVAFQGLAWDPQSTPAAFLADFRRPDDGACEVLVVHGEVGSARARRSQDLPATAEELASAGADYVALGHRHAFLELRLSGRLWGAYPGTPFGLSFREPELGTRRAALVTLEPGREPRVEPVSTTSVEWMRLPMDLAHFGSRQELVAAVAGSAGGERLALVELSGAAAFPLAVEELEAELRGRFIHLAVEDASVEVSAQVLERLSSEQSVRGIFARRMQARLAAARDEAQRAELAEAVREGLRALAEDGALRH